MVFIIDICGVGLVIGGTAVLDVDDDDGGMSGDRETLHRFFDLRGFVERAGFRIDFGIIAGGAGVVTIAGDVDKTGVVDKIGVIGKTNVIDKTSIVDKTDIVGKIDVVDKTDVVGKIDVVGKTGVVSKTDVVDGL